MEYRVTWIIDLDAESIEDAARPLGKRGLYQASLRARGLSLFSHPDSLATHFIVQDQKGDDREVWADSKYPW